MTAPNHTSSVEPSLSILLTDFQHPKVNKVDAWQQEVQHEYPFSGQAELCTIKCYQTLFARREGYDVRVL
eukprot:893416-Amphidinium_carterae.1